MQKSLNNEMMKITARIGSVLSWSETRGIPPLESYHIEADFEVYFYRNDQRYSKRFTDQIFATINEIPDTGNEIDVIFNEMTGEISLP